MLTQRQMLEQVVDWKGNGVALKNVNNGEELTYSEFDSRVNRLANGLMDRGVRDGDRVAIVLENTMEFPIALFACYKIPAVPVPLNYHLESENLKYIFDEINPEEVIYDGQFASAVETAVESASVSPGLIGVGVDPADGISFEALSESGSPERPPEINPNPGRVSYILYTSGTTGKPKGVTFTQQTAYHRIQESYSSLGPRSDDTVSLQLSPFFHAGGIGASVHPVLCGGGTLLIASDWGPGMAPQAIDEHNVTHVITVPTVARHIAKRDDVSEFDFSTIEALICMGAPLSKSLSNVLIENVTENIYNLYGSTETLYSLLLRPNDIPEKAGTVGRPVSSKEIQIVSFEPGAEPQPGDVVEPGEEGEILIKGEGSVDYYFGDKEATEAAIKDGWFYSNDLGVRDEDGFVTVTGRTDDMILSGGELVSPVEVEETLEDHESVEVAVVVGVQDKEWGQRVKAYIVGEDITADDLDEYCKDNEALADYKRPKEYEFVDTVERTATGKKQRFKYRSS